MNRRQWHGLDVAEVVAYLETDLADSFRRAGLDFIAAIRDGTPPRLDAREARSVLAFSLAAIRSAVEQREIALSELDA